MKPLKATAARAFPLMAVCSLGFKRLYKTLHASSPRLIGLGGLLALFLSGCQHHAPAPLSRQATPSPTKYNCERLVSFSPSITEIVYSLGLDNNLVGVTRFCKYPPAAQKKSSVGGYLDPNLEAVIRLRPTLVLLREEQSDLKGRLANFERPTLSLEHRNVAGILQSFRRIGQACHREQRAEQEVTDLERQIADVRQKIQAAKMRPRVLVVVDRDIRYNTVKNVYVPARDGFYDWLISEAGANNAAQGQNSGFSEVSTEGILRLNPDVIIEIMPALAGSKYSQEDVQRAWMTMPSLTAVKTHRLYLFTDDYMSIPGPRFVKTLRKFAETLHPELDWRKHG